MISSEIIYIHVTRRCNLNCSYCYFSAGEIICDEILTEDILSVFREIYSLKPKKVVITGGEPLLREDIFDIGRAFRSGNQENKITLSLNTNGTFITSENAKHLVSIFDEIRISVDGFKEVNDPIRGDGSYEKAIEALHYIKEAGGAPVAFITVTSLNIGQLQKFMKYLLGNGFFLIHVSPINLVGRAAGRKDLLIKKEELGALVDRFWYETFGMQLTSEKMNCSNCGVGRYITVYPDGTVYPCHLLSFPEFCVGNIKERSLYDMFHHSLILVKLRRLDFQNLEFYTKHVREDLGKDACIGLYLQDEADRKEFVEYLYNSETNCLDGWRGKSGFRRLSKFSKFFSFG